LAAIKSSSSGDAMCDADERIESVGVASGIRLYGTQLIYGYFRNCWFWRFRLHFFLKPEPSVMFHDHAWGFWTFPLHSYVERVHDHRTGERFRLHFRPATYTHKYMGKWSGRYDEHGEPTAIPALSSR
jgi:hypothetical protein